MSAATTSATIVTQASARLRAGREPGGLRGTCRGLSGDVAVRMKHAAGWLRPAGSDSPKRSTTGRALDIGCADGSHAFLLAEHGYEVTGIDFSPRMIELARDRRTPVTPSPTFFEGEFLTGNSATPWQVVALERQFELVVANAFVHLFPKPVDDEVVRSALDLVAPVEQPCSRPPSRTADGRPTWVRSVLTEHMWSDGEATTRRKTSSASSGTPPETDFGSPACQLPICVAKPGSPCLLDVERLRTVWDRRREVEPAQIGDRVDHLRHDRPVPSTVPVVPDAEPNATAAAAPSRGTPRTRWPRMSPAPRSSRRRARPHR